MDNIRYGSLCYGEEVIEAAKAALLMIPVTLPGHDMEVMKKPITYPRVRAATYHS